MYSRPPNPNYTRTPFLHTPPYSSAGGGPPPFSDPYSRPPFPPPYRGAPPRPPPPALRGSGPESFGGRTDRDPFYEVAPPNQFQHSQPPQGWTVQQTDLQSLEVRKKAEEFLRILEAKDKLELSGQSGEKVTKRQSQDDETESHSSEKFSSMRSKSRARSRGRSRHRSRSRSRSRGKSRVRSRSRGRSRAKSRAKSRARSRTRSRSRGKSRTRAKSRVRSRSRSHDKPESRSKSQPRIHSSKDSQWSVKEPSGVSNNNNSSSNSSIRVSPPDSTVPDLFQGLRQVLQSKELEKHLSVAKGALLWNQIPNESREIQEHQPTVGSYQRLPELHQNAYNPERPTGIIQSGLLPHERVGEGADSFPRILSWNDPSQQTEVRPMFSNIEDEEEFLYGEEEERTKPQAVTVPLAQTRPVQSPVETVFSSSQSPYLTQTLLSQTSSLHEPQTQPTSSKQPTDSANVALEDCEKVKNMLKTIGLNLSMTDLSKMAARLKQKQVEQKGGSPAAGLGLLKPALEALQALSKAPKSDDSRSNRSGSSHSHKDSRDDHKEKRSEEKERREKQIQMKRKEYLVKELEGLLKQEGSGDLIPVIGFFCQQCEEFFGDLNSAEGHIASHRRSEAQKKAVLDHHDRHKDKGHGEHQQRPPPSEFRERPPVQDKRSAASRIYQDFRERSPERKRLREKSPQSHSSSSHGTELSKTKAESEKMESKEESKDKTEDVESSKSEKKKKKKEKKLKKKEKKKEKKKKKEKEECS